MFLEIAPTILSEGPKENFPLLKIEFKPLIQSIEQKINDEHQYHYIDLICDYINELTKHSSTLWFVSERLPRLLFMGMKQIPASFDSR